MRKERIPLIKIDEVVVLGEVTLTTSALHVLLERDIEITFLGARPAELIALLSWSEDA